MRSSWLRIGWVFVLLLAGCDGSGSSGAPRAEMGRRVQSAVERIEARYPSEGPGVSYAITWRGETLASGGVGLADLEWGVANDDSTVFRLGSISKTLTAVASLQVVEAGELDLDEPVARYAPELPDPIGLVTMRQLLSHRSGLAEHAFDEALIPFIWRPMTTDQILELQAGKSASFEPGARYEYVNFNYVVVAHVIERITGESFVAYADERIFSSNGMRDSHYDVHDRIIPRRAELYDEKDGVVTNAADVDMSHVSAAGALLSSARDMARWARLLVQGELIGPETLADAWTPAPLPDGTPTRYGLGFNVGEIAGEPLLWHTGLTPGGQAAFGLAPESGVFFVVLSNGFHLPNTGELMTEIMAILVAGKASSG